MLIEKLTPEQEALLPIVRDRWLRIGLSTEPAKREEAEEGVRLAYKIAGLAPPKFMVWLDSPMAGACAAYNMLLDQVSAQVMDQVSDRGRAWDEIIALVRDQDRYSDKIQVSAQVWQKVWEQIFTPVSDQVSVEVWDQVWVRVWGQFRAQASEQVWMNLRCGYRQREAGQIVRNQILRCGYGQHEAGQILRCGYGQHEANWLSWVDFFREIRAPLNELSKLEGLIQIAKSCGWWWPFENVCILTERPTALHRDERHRLHSEIGMAIQYPDGWGIYAWHGVVVPQRVITSPESLTPQEILAEENVEVRRVMIERFGLERFLEQSNAQECDSSEFGTLYKIRLPNDELAVVRVTCPSTGRKYVLPVRPQVQTAREAVASTFGLSEQEYQPSVQT